MPSMTIAADCPFPFLAFNIVQTRGGEAEQNTLTVQDCPPARGFLQFVAEANHVSPLCLDALGGMAEAPAQQRSRNGTHYENKKGKTCHEMIAKEMH